MTCLMKLGPCQQLRSCHNVAAAAEMDTQTHCRLPADRRAGTTASAPAGDMAADTSGRQPCSREGPGLSQLPGCSQLSQGAAGRPRGKGVRSASSGVMVVTSQKSIAATCCEWLRPVHVI